jgi:hypothetical protein
MTTLLSILLLLVEPSTAPATTAPASNSGNPTVVIVVGAEGTPEYGKDFGTWADRWEAASKQRSAQFIAIGRDGSGDDASADDHGKLKSVLEHQLREGTDPLWLVFIGHGTFDGKEAKFNLRGPDVSDAELAEWLRPIHRPLAVIDCSSSSAPFLNKLSAKNRVIITATRSGSEIQFSRFGDYLSAAIADPTADLDKDGQTSLLEAFLAASHRTEEFYKQASRLATEHALLEDTGDALGVSADWFDGLRATRAARDGAAIDGTRAHQWSLVLSASEQAMPAELRGKRDALELQVEALRAKKKSLSEDAYYAQLEKIMLELAHVYDSAAAATQPTAAK